MAELRDKRLTKWVDCVATENHDGDTTPAMITAARAEGREIERWTNGSRHCMDKLAAYEDAEEQGLLVRAPEEGEIVFFIEGFSCGACQQWHYRVREDRFDRFMRFFLTRAEAEAALSKEANDVRPT